MTTNLLRVLCTIAASAAVATGLGCGDSAPGSVRASARIVGESSALGAATVTMLNGTYTGCSQRSGAWSVLVSGSAALTNSALSVVTNDTACVLSLTGIVADQTYVPSSAIALTASYKSTALAFAPSGGGSTAFVANAKLDAVTFASDFVLSLAYSADVTTVDGGDALAVYATVTPSTVATVVPAPSYTLSLTSGTALTIQIDASKAVTSASGVATLTDGAQVGETYVVDQGTLGATPTFAEVAAAYAAGTERTISGANPTVTASYFGLSGQSLATGVVRTLIVAHTFVAVKGYQLFRITFKAP